MIYVASTRSIGPSISANNFYGDPPDLKQVKQVNVTVSQLKQSDRKSRSTEIVSKPKRNVL